MNFLSDIYKVTDDNGDTIHLTKSYQKTKKMKNIKQRRFDFFTSQCIDLDQGYSLHKWTK